MGGIFLFTMMALIWQLEEKMQMRAIMLLVKEKGIVFGKEKGGERHLNWLSFSVYKLTSF